MKKLLILLCGLLAIAIVSGCSTVIPQGFLHTDTTLPAQIATNTEVSKDLKVGTSTSSSYFGVYCTGDASLKAAIENGKLSKVSFVDWKVSNPWWIGLKTVYTTTVYGE